MKAGVMTTYDLYLESGPRHKKTMVHVMALLGCIANGRTTEDALAATPDAIRAFKQFLASHGESIEVDAPFETRVAAHVTEGVFLGQGDSSIDYVPDLEPVSLEQLALHTRHYAWLHADLLARVANLDEAALAAEPTKGRGLGRILSHVMGAETAYVRSFCGPVEGLNTPAKLVDRGEMDVREGFALTGELIVRHLESLSESDLARTFQRGKSLWTAHKGLRRLLEHCWEHLREVEVRLGVA
jgi:predicted RNase H-like HicB family nuclease/uncharacterized damage-inducible protein DinB